MDCVLHYDDNIGMFVAFDKDPCPDCKHPTCKNAGEPHRGTPKLFILPKKLVINHYGGFNVKCPHCDKEIFLNVKVK